MVPILARQAIVIKSKNETAMLLGNYEIAYAIGVMLNILGQPLPEKYDSLEELLQYTLGALNGYEPSNENEKNIIKMLKECKALDNFDEQVKELLQMGLDEKRLWMM